MENNVDTDKDLQKREEYPLRKSGEKPAGIEELDIKTDIILPRLLILQGLSQIVSDGKGQAGQIANSVTKEVFGESFDFIPLYVFKTKIMFEVGEGLVLYSRNGLTIDTAADKYSEYVGKPCEETPFNAWRGQEPPELSLVYNYPCLNVNRIGDFPLSLSLMRSAAKTAKTLNSMIVTSGEDMFARKYRITTKKEDKGKGPYYAPVIELLGRCTDEEYAIGKKFFATMRTKVVDVDLEEEEPGFEE